MDTDAQPYRLNTLAELAPYLLVAACLAVLLVFILLAQFAHPSSDDFCMVSGVNEHGLMAQLWNHYLEWSGRYSSNALYAVYPIVFDLFDGYKYIPAIVIAALLLATAFFLSTLFASRIYSRPVLLASLGFVSVYLLGMMSPASGLYWMAGVFTYQTANILLLVMLGLMIRLADKQRQSENDPILLGMLLLVIVIAIGANETSMIAITAMTLFACILYLRYGWGMLWPWLIMLVVALAGFLVVYVSPGNEVRASDFPLRHDFSRSIQGSLSVGSRILWIWISSPVLITATMLTPFAVSKLVHEADRQFKISPMLIGVLLICTFTLPFLLQFPAWWAMGGWPPARTVDAIYFLFLLGWFLSVGVISLYFLRFGQTADERKFNGWLAAVAFFTASILFSIAVIDNKTFRMAKTDLLHLGRPYSDYMNERYQRIEQAVTEGRLYLAVADYEQEYPPSIYFNDIMYKPDHWRNRCYANYFGLSEIRRIQ